jgi:small-conductance mechanosensitive channel/CRP-like cAMP-binding protein
MAPLVLRFVLLGLLLAGLTALLIELQADVPAADAALHAAFSNPPSPLATPPLGAAPGRWWLNTQMEALEDRAGYVILAMLLAAAILALFAPLEMRRLRASAVCLLGYVVTLPLAGFILSRSDLDLYGRVRFLGMLLEEVAIAGLIAVLVSWAAHHLFKSAMPVILADILLVGVYAAIGLELLSRAGVNISGIIATSAVLTAVIGFSLQDSLGNIASGVFLSLENVIRVGDWVKVNELVGRVREIRWRQTTIETRSWDIVVVPNSVLMKNHVVVYGRREGLGVSHRQTITFSVDLSASPTVVLETVRRSLTTSPIENMALNPPLQVLLLDLNDGVGTYAVRYWLLDLGPDEPTDSRVRERVYYALQRAGLRLAAPAHAVTVTEDTPEQRDRQAEKAHQRRIAALKAVDIFRALDDVEVNELAESLQYSPYAPGEVVTREGDISDSLYLIMHGTASVTLAQDGLERHVAELHPGTVFGEMGLLTGEPRSATVAAVTELECWRLDRASFEGVIRRRPEIATELSRILADRKLGLDAARHDLARDRERKALSSTQHDLLKRITRYLGLRANA